MSDCDDTWLHATPYATRDLCWPPDAVFSLEERYGDKARMSVLDDRWAFLAYPKATIAADESWIYYADVAPPDLPKDSGADIVIERVAVLQDRVDLLSVCPRDSCAAFVTLKWDEIALSITLTAHALDGLTIATRTIPAHAAYGRIVIDGTRAAVCLSSRRAPADTDPSCQGWPWPRNRVLPSKESALLFGDRIAVWDWQADTLEVVDLAMPHQASLTFLSAGAGIALAALSPPDRGHPYPVLQVIPSPTASNQVQVRGRSFTEGVVKMQEIDNTLAQRGSSSPAQVVAHAYHTGGRLAVFSQHILTAPDVDVQPTTDDPRGLIETLYHPSDMRTLRLRFAGSAPLPVQAGTRILVTRDPDDPNSDDEDDEDDDTDEDEEDRAAPLWILDFDPARLRALTALTPAERVALDAELARADPGAEVKVVTRRFHVDSEGGEMDLEPELETDEANLDANTDIHTVRKFKGRVLVYDESATAPREGDQVGSGYTRTKLALPLLASASGREHVDLALTTSGVLRVPQPGKPGCMYYYRF